MDFPRFNFITDMNRPFRQSYKCFSVSMFPGNERHDVEKGGKIIMPPSALDQLTRLNVEYPMLFKLTNPATNTITHAGVLEFVADERNVYLPYWMKDNLCLSDEGGMLQIESVSLPVATYSKFQPQNPDFLDITNPKAVLENALRNFACLTKDDIIVIKYNSRDYKLKVLETQPGDAVKIIECDMNVEFAPPVGYKEPERVKPNDEPMAIDHAELMPEETGFVQFSGAGNRLDGKEKKEQQSQPVSLKKPYVRGIPDYNHPFGLIKFDRSVRPVSSDSDKDPDNDKFSAFKGEGFSLRRPRPRN